MGLVANAAHGLVGLLEIVCAWVFGPSSDPWLWSDDKFWIGLLMWGGVWFRYHTEPAGTRYEVVAQYHLTAILAFGVNLLVLSMVQSMGASGIFGFVLICGSNVQLTRVLFPHRRLAEKDAFRATNMYENLEAPMPQVTVLFVGQSILTLFLLYSAYYRYDQSGTSKSTYTFWLAAYISVQMSGFFKRGGDSLVGRPFDLEQWRALRDRNASVEYRTGSGDWFTKPRAEMVRRGRMGFCVNTFFREIIMFITPLLCMQSEDAVDFVQNCFALSYITTLDDMGEPKEFKIREREAAPADAGDLEARLVAER